MRPLNTHSAPHPLFSPPYVLTTGTSLPGSSSFLTFIYWLLSEKCPSPALRTAPLPCYVDCAFVFDLSCHHTGYSDTQTLEMPVYVWGLFPVQREVDMLQPPKTWHTAAHMLLNEWTDAVLLNATTPGLNSPVCHLAVTPGGDHPYRQRASEGSRALLLHILLPCQGTWKGNGLWFAPAQYPEFQV